VATHDEVGLLNLSVWRDQLCVGTVKLRPDEVVDLVGALTEGLAQLAADRTPVARVREAARLAALEDRLAGMESRLATPPWRRAVADAGTAAAALVDRLLRHRGRV
jgi:hypothetical protein